MPSEIKATTHEFWGDTNIQCIAGPCSIRSMPNPLSISITTLFMSPTMKLAMAKGGDELTFTGYVSCRLLSVSSAVNVFWVQPHSFSSYFHDSDI